MGSMNEAGKSKSAGRWFMGNLLRHPASYIGLAAAIGVGLASFPVGMPMGGIIGMSVMVGMLSFLVGHGIKASHGRARENENIEHTATLDEELLAGLREVEEGEVAAVLERMSEDRDAIGRLLADSPGNEDASHTLELVSAILIEAASQAEELQDLARRSADPLLSSPDDATKKISELRRQIESAYSAVADSRSRLRRGEKLARRDFLAPTASSSLSALTEQLTGETEIARRVEERVRRDFGNVVFPSEEDEENSSMAGENGSWEKE